MNSKAKKFVAVAAVTVIASIGLAGPSSAAASQKPVKSDRGYVMFKIGDTWCC